MWDEDKYFFNRHDSVSDSVSGSTAGALAGLAAIPLALVFSAVGILIMRITSSMQPVLALFHCSLLVTWDWIQKRV